MTGRITLYDRAGDLVDSRVYPSLVARNDIVRSWKQKYAKKYDDCFLQIEPNSNSERVHDNGINKNSRHHETRP
jgi:hypothetical protein